ncbi:MAG TPA: hypothetical protein VFJ74_05430 [Gemmatimonadaceae bacterium]|nr:hypothetical protein [Gemmatimonadaceae bacterium]
MPTSLLLTAAALVAASVPMRPAGAQDGDRRREPGEVAYGITAQAAPRYAARGGGDDVARGDSLLRRGRVIEAESAYYDAARHAPRDPAARLALGRYLASRGALRIGAVLMEEARFFGGDAKTIGAELAPVYARLGDYRSLAALPGSPLTSAERARAEWLRDHAPEAKGPDSTRAPYAPDAGGAGTLGRVTLSLGGEAVEATIDPAVRGLVLDTAWARRPEDAKAFGARQSGGAPAPVGAALAVKLGELTLTNVPTRFAAQPGGRAAARIGVDVLAALAPTFDERTRTLTLRRGGRVARDLPGEHLPTVTLAAGVWLASPSLAAGGASAPASASLSAERARALLRGTRWTMDARRGEVIVER